MPSCFPCVFLSPFVPLLRSVSLSLSSFSSCFFPLCIFSLAHATYLSPTLPYLHPYPLVPRPALSWSPRLHLVLSPFLSFPCARMLPERETRSCQSSDDQPPTRAGTRQCDTYMRSLLATLARLFRRARISTRVSAYATTDVLVHVTLGRGCLPTKEAPRLFNVRPNVSQDTSFVCLLLHFGIYWMYIYPIKCLTPSNNGVHGWRMTDL